jgi:peptidyl-tRNA hydrolase, PTH1 family
MSIGKIVERELAGYAKMDTNTEQKQPFLIIGLGNPGRRYRKSRHNIGFMVLDQLAAGINTSFSRSQAEALVTDGRHKGSKIILAKPQTYMNESGRSVGSLARFYQIESENVLVIFDDLDLPLGKLRLRPGGGSGGHRGMRSIFQHLGNQDFPRLRIGIDRPNGRMDPAAYVLQDFDKDDAELVAMTIQRSVESVFSFIERGIQTTMNHYNVQSE